MSTADTDYVLSLNAGSSSLKISLYSVSANHVLQGHAHDTPEPVSLVLTSSISNITAPPAKFAFHLIDSAGTPSNADTDEPSDAIKDHTSAFAHFLQCLQSQASIDHKRVIYICHRVVHGGGYSQPIIIDEESYHHIEKLSDLAPLHNGAALSVIKACMSALPDSKSIAYFDTSFHCTIPLHISSCAINQEIAKKRGLKKYGFHGLSYSFILRSVSQFLDKPPESLNLILLHLGSGASACLVKDGKSLDTSMGLTPLNGLPGATRSGSVDPSLIFHYTNKAGRITHDPSMATQVHVTMAEDILNRKSGWKAMTGTTDFGVITAKAELDNPDPEIAAHNPNRLASTSSSTACCTLSAQVDALVFAGGIGERGVKLRSIIAEKMRCVGYCEVDEAKNDGVGKEGGVVVDISVGERGDEGRQKRILVCRTDEQLEMARQCTLDPRFWNEI
ncbi:Acetokinase family-domain-containing protein [Flammula alnicola]|nr:Acetokinase family-domain-containing protein [Flammula alnicola]